MNSDKTVIVAGHTKEKMKHVCSIIPPQFSSLKIFNGVDKYPEAIHTNNHPTGRDVDMYYKAMMTSDSNIFAFINDDVKYLGKQFWEEYKNFCTDISGVGNLSSWVNVSKLSGWIYNKSISQGKNLLFIRTSAFIITRDYFLKLFSISGNSAQAFEKNTLKYTSSYRILDPCEAYDSNIEPYIG